MTRSAQQVARSRVIPVGAGEAVGFAGLKWLMKIDERVSDGRFALAEFPHMPPRMLAAPLHRHHREDEYTYVLEGAVGIQLAEDVITATPGTLVLKARGQWHTFWNAGDSPCRTIEIVSPAGFENYFRELAAPGGDSSRLVQLNQKYAIDMDFDSVPELCRRFGLAFPQH